MGYMMAYGRCLCGQYFTFSRSEVNITSADTMPDSDASACSITQPQEEHHIPESWKTASRSCRPVFQ